MHVHFLSRAAVKLPSHFVIATQKLTRYLLALRPIDDKSRFLALVGFSVARPEELEAGIRRLAASHDAKEDGTSEYGKFWRVEGVLLGPRGRLKVVAIWLERSSDHSFHFVTLKPLKETRP